MTQVQVTRKAKDELVGVLKQNTGKLIRLFIQGMG